MVRLIRIALSKRLPDQHDEVFVGYYEWREPDLPTRAEFFAAWEELYDSVQKPFLPTRAVVEVESDSGGDWMELDTCEDAEGAASDAWRWLATFRERS